jgi:DNA ligase-1
MKRKFCPMSAASLLPPNVEHTDDNILEAMSRLRYPVLCSVKLDGIRAIRANGTLLSKRLKPIPNRSIRDRSMLLPGGYDMELYNRSFSYSEIESIVMSREHKDSDLIQFYVLDNFNLERMTYEQRMRSIDKDLRCWSIPPFKFSFPHVCSNANSLFLELRTIEDLGGEGICFRDPNGLYIQKGTVDNRSTLTEQTLVKFARYLRTELLIIGFEEQMENVNPTNHNALGAMDRSSHQDNMIPKNTLGAFICQHPDGYTVNVGTGVGLTNQLRKRIWMNQDKYLGKFIVGKYKPVGQKDKLRHPIFMGFRNGIDI